MKMMNRRGEGSASDSNANNDKPNTYYQSASNFSHSTESNSILDSNVTLESEGNASANVNVNTGGKIHSNQMNDFSEESTQAVYEEIEVQHQSLMEPSMRGDDIPHDLKIGARSRSNLRHNGSNGLPQNTNQSPKRKRGQKDLRANNGYHHHRSENGGIASKLRFDFKGGKSVDSSSQEQSISTWFPVPSLSLFQPKADKESKQRLSNRPRSPLSSQSQSTTPSMPFDEGGRRSPPQNSSFYSSSPASSISTRKFLSPSEIPDSNDRLARHRERPWNLSPQQTKKASPKYVKVSNQRLPTTTASNTTPRNSPTYNNNSLDTISNSFSSEKPQSVVSPSPRQKYRNPFSSSNSSDVSAQKQMYRNPFSSSYSSDALTQKQKYRNPFSSSYSSDASSHYVNSKDSFHSTNNQEQQLHCSSTKPYTNPFDSFPSTDDLSQQQPEHQQRQELHHNQNNIRPSRQSSKSPIRQRIVKPPLRTNESKFHSLLSCATSPNDPKWMDALHMLVSSSNPRQLAKMKIPHAHNWTALHIAALSNPPLFLIYALLLVYPEAVKEEDSGGRLPIHLAAGSEATVGVLSILVRFYDESVIIEDGRGLVPLHLAFLRDAGEEMSTDVVRVLLGQSLAGVKKSSNGSFTRKVKDGCMRRGEHLNFTLSDVKEGMFGDNPNRFHMKEKRKRELRIKSMDPNRDNFSRGFASDINESDSSDGFPFKHDYLSTLWEDESVMDVDIFGDIEMEETRKFSAEVHQYLRKLPKAIKKAKISEQKEANENSFKRTLSPASIPTPNARLPIHMAIKRNFQVAESLQLSLPQQNDVLRILIHANPSSLMYRDNLGRTPILTCLDMIDASSVHKVDLEMVELLLGMRVPGFRVAPQWLEDADIVKSQQQKTHDWYIYNSPCFTVYNPAMVPSIKTLPLHIAAMKALSAPIIYTIFYCYTGAKYVQDENNRTPLHCALSTMTPQDSFELDLDVLSLLIDEKIVSLRDMQNIHVFDLMVDNGIDGRIPSSLSSKTQALEYGSDQIEKKEQLQKLFHQSIADLVASADSYKMYHEILHKVRHLPPWLRQIIFQTSIAQDILLSRVSGPMSFAFIMLHGMALIMLITLFIGFVDYSIDHTTNLPQSLVLMLALSLIYLTLNGLAYAVMAFRLNLGWDYCIVSVRSWITFVALVLISLFVRERINIDDYTYRLSSIHLTTTIAFLWVMVVVYLSRWCYGVNVLFIRMSKLGQNLISTSVILALLVIAYLQMTYLSYRVPMGFDDKCVVVDHDGKEICSIWGSIQSYSFLFSRAEIDHLNNYNSPGVDFLNAVFYVVLLFLAVYSVSITIVSIQHIKLKESLVAHYWVPMYIHILLIQDLSSIFARKKPNRQYEQKQNYWSINNLSCFTGFEQKLELVWDYILSSFECVQNKNSKWWSYKQSASTGIIQNVLFIRFIGIVIIPIWVIIGILSLGTLWPPQYRRWLLTWSNSDNYMNELHKDSKLTKGENAEDSLIRMKCMISDRFDDIHGELDNIKRRLS